MTFTFPEPLANELLKSVPSRDRSRYVAEALIAKLRQRNDLLASACDEANRNEDVLEIEKDFDLISADIAEPRNDAKAR